MDWFRVAQEALETFFDVQAQVPQPEKQQRTSRAFDAFDHIFQRLAGKLQLREKWPTPHCDIAPFRTGIIERSLKMGVDFSIGTSLDGWYAEAWIVHPDQIRHMRDEYWEYITRVAAIGNAEFYDGGRPIGWASSPNRRKLVQHKTSLVYAIARDFTLLSEDAGPETDLSSFGRIEVTIPVDSSEAQVTAFFEDAIEALYRSNYLLYRSAYLQHKRVLKKVSAEHAAADL